MQIYWMWTSAIPHKMSYFRSFRLNKHQKPLRKQKYLCPKWPLFLLLSGTFLCAAENEFSIAMAVHSWCYLCLAPDTMNKTIPLHMSFAISAFVHTLISPTISIQTPEIQPQTMYLTSGQFSRKPHGFRSLFTSEESSTDWCFLGEAQDWESSDLNYHLTSLQVSIP